MIIHASRDFAARYKCRMSQVGDDAAQTGRIDAWSAHFFKFRSQPLVLLMHDASLSPILIEAKGITKLDVLFPLFLARVQDLWRAHDRAFDCQNQSMVFLPRSNRSLIGSMNDAIHHTKFHAEEARIQGRTIDWVEIEHFVHVLPFGCLSYSAPYERLRDLLAG